MAAQEQPGRCPVETLVSVEQSLASFRSNPAVTDVRFGVISGHFALQWGCPLYPRKRTLGGVNGMSAKAKRDITLKVYR
jgi:hypothetical protein